MALIDTTGSMTWPNEEGSDTARKDVLGEALGIIVEKLGAHDSQAEKEQGSGEDAGGLMAVTFAQDNVHKIGDLSPENWRTKWSQIRWGNGTEIMPGWTALGEVYLDEFGDVPQLDRPKMLALVITDGEANDTDAFAEEIRKVGNRAYVVLAIMGYGEEHDRALSVYQDVASVNDHVRVVSFGNTTDPNRLADAVVSLVGV
ncbi:MAG: vWA domain-containing protein [Solirubrobacteraceae bacterium]